MNEKTFSKQDIAALAGELTGLYMQALESGEGEGLRYPDLVFAALVGLKGVGVMLSGDENGVREDLREIFERAVNAKVVGKRFQNEDEMKAWLAEQGRNPDGSPAKPDGPVH